jgi:hypothetical protein
MNPPTTTIARRLTYKQSLIFPNFIYTPSSNIIVTVYEKKTRRKIGVGVSSFIPINPERLQHSRRARLYIPLAVNEGCRFKIEDLAWEINVDGKPCINRRKIGALISYLETYQLPP